VRWRYDERLDVWCRIGKDDQLPLADSNTPGLLSKEDKIVLDSIPPAGGAFGLIAQPFILNSPDNPSGVMEGTLNLCSESLDILCVDSQGQEFPEECGIISTCDVVDQPPPGMQFSLSQKFLDTLCFEAFGPTGPPGRRGEQGDDGMDGFTDSPRGDQGTAGQDATEAAEFLGIKIEELEEIRDSVIVEMELDPASARLSSTTAMMNVPESDEPADQLVVLPTRRTLFYPLLADDPVEYTTLDDWRISVPPGDPNQEPDLLLFKIPQATQIGQEVDLIPVRLSVFIQSIADFFKVCLASYEEQWLEEVCEFINGKDEQARTILASMAQRLAECEFKRPIQFCLGIEPGECPETLVRNINIIQAEDQLADVDVNITNDPLTIDGNITVDVVPSPAP
jgi:hypothetical protein